MNFVFISPNFPFNYRQFCDRLNRNGCNVLGIGDAPIIGDFPCTGMHGGRLFFRAPAERVALPEKVRAATASEDDLAAIRPYLAEYCRLFGVDLETVCAAPFTTVTPDSKNPYKQLYVAN